MCYAGLSACIFIGLPLVEGIRTIFIGAGLANKMFSQSAWQVAVLVNKADIEIRTLQIPRLWIWTKPRAVAVEYIMPRFVGFCLTLGPKSVVLGKWCEKENCSAEDHRARKEQRSG